MGGKPFKLKSEYGTGAFGQGCLLARKLTEAGAACVEVNTGGWDMHNGIFPQLERRLPEIDSGIGTLHQGPVRPRPACKTPWS